MMKKVKVLVAVAVILAFGWFLVASPLLTFHKNEKIVEEAGKRYYELNSMSLPTGERVRTVYLKQLYQEKILSSDIYAPYGNKACSLEKSWVKVKKVNNDYEYYTYLDCGILKSSIDAVGPVIKLNGKDKITLGVGEEYKEEGVSSVVDNADGKLDIKDVTIKGNVDTSKVGSYEISYIAFDSLSNRTVVTRTVNVVQKIYNKIKNDLGEETVYKGLPDNNYVRLSNMMFQIYGIDENKNVILVAAQDVSNVNYTKLDSWLEYYYGLFNKKAQKMIVPMKYCNMSVDENNTNTTECTSYTEKKKMYIPSIVDVNKTRVDNGDTYMTPVTMSWLSTSKDSKEAYVTRNVFFYDDFGKIFVPFNKEEIYGVRPMFAIKGDTLIRSGSGEFRDPYLLPDYSYLKSGSLLNDASVGDYIEDGNSIWVVVDTLKDGTTKAITTTVLTRDRESTCKQDSSTKRITYNPKNKESNAYCINNKASQYLDTSKLVRHKIEVPIYKDKIIYGEEINKKEYNVVVSAPDIFEIFSASNGSGSYWCKNTSLSDNVGAAITEIGVPYNVPIVSYTRLSIRAVGYFKEGTVVSTGTGRADSPYKIK